ncbi:MAG: hypothetical protein M1837_005287 [Sclerophora amabilis]|nr:MAG: hypothetical protein M1837_005287 [Sclerophora amabilis]
MNTWTLLLLLAHLLSPTSAFRLNLIPRVQCFETTVNCGEIAECRLPPAEKDTKVTSWELHVFAGNQRDAEKMEKECTKHCTCKTIFCNEAQMELMTEDECLSEGIPEGGNECNPVVYGSVIDVEVNWRFKGRLNYGKHREECYDWCQCHSTFHATLSEAGDSGDGDNLSEGDIEDQDDRGRGRISNKESESDKQGESNRQSQSNRQSESGQECLSNHADDSGTPERGRNSKDEANLADGWEFEGAIQDEAWELDGASRDEQWVDIQSADD